MQTRPSLSTFFRAGLVACLALGTGCSKSVTPSLDASVGVDASSAVDAAAPASDLGDAGAVDLSTDAAINLVAARPYKSHVPASYDATKPTPLVLMLHGYNSNAAAHEAYFQLIPASDAHGFLYAYPDGLPDILGKQGWNASDACCIFQPQKPDDLSYLTAVLDDMASKYNVDPKRIFIVGHSNGGFMAQAVACALSTRIAAVVSQAGAVFADATQCKATSPVAFRQIHASNDDTISYDGGKVFFLAAAYPSAHQTVATWAAKSGCAATLLTNVGTQDVTTAVAGAETVVDRYDGCSGGSTVELWTMNGIPTDQMPHQPALTAGYAETAWTFFAAHPKP